MKVGRNGQAFVEGSDDRLENRRHVKPRIDAHFRQMFVSQAKRVGTRRVDALRALVIGDHLLAAAGVAGDGIGRDLRIGGQQATYDQRPDRQNEGAGVASGIGDAFAGADFGALILGQFGQAKRPGGVDAVRRRRVNDAGSGIVRQRHRSPCGIVR